MTWMKWLPWRYLVKYVARKHGFVDPIALLAKLHGFAQPSEVGEPIELLRADGGCMGDGHHVWASAEWVLMIRNCFVRQEGEQLILGAGVPRRWLDQPDPISYGPAPTDFGPVSVRIIPDAAPPRIQILAPLATTGRYRFCYRR